MENISLKRCIVFLIGSLSFNLAQSINLPMNKEPAIPRFSVAYMDTNVSPSEDFYRFANGTWIKNNPVPADKSTWSSFNELSERNNFLIHQILSEASTGKQKTYPASHVGDFFASAMNTQKIEALRFKPITKDLERIEQLKSTDDLFKFIGAMHKLGTSTLFSTDTEPDAKESDFYAFYFGQGGLSLPDRDYYLEERFTDQRQAYQAHVKNMFMLLGESQESAETDAETILKLETALATASRTREALRDPLKNYNKMSIAEFISHTPGMPWQTYFSERGINLSSAIIGQPEFFEAVSKLVKEVPMTQWKTYLRWKVLHFAAPYLHAEVADENFNFYGKVLSGQLEQEPRWKRAARIIDACIGEALGQLYVEQNFPKEARERMQHLVDNLQAVFKERINKLSWMSAATKQKALYKLSRFGHKIGYPDKFIDYSSVNIRREDYFGNIKRTSLFEVERRTVRIGKKVDKAEWEMTPPTVNAYFNPLLNEIAFPAGILQPPFFDINMDDAVNYGAIGVVIGHEMTHGYDDQGRQYNAEGILSDWWSEEDAHEFEKRAQQVVNEYNTFEALPGLHVNGKLTLGENIADLGGISIAYDALQRELHQNPSKRQLIDGFTPEQRFFLSFAQVWRTNIRDEEQKKRLTTDPHAPGRFRAVGPLLNHQAFYDAFNVKPGSTEWLEPELRANIW